MTHSIAATESSSKQSARSVKKIEKKLEKVELHNRELTTENINLKEKLLDLEYKQNRNNLVFEGVTDSDAETDVQCINKL